MSEKDNFGFFATHTRLGKWINEIKEYETITDLTEADTRSKFIDSFFIEVLNWNESQITREGYVNKIGFYDYVFNSGKNEFVLEAKKTKVDFEMPRSRTIKYKTLGRKSKLMETIIQGMDYAAIKGIDNVIVFNGKQLAITYLPYTVLENHDDTYLFWSIEDIRDNFTRLYNFLSPAVDKNDFPKYIVPDVKELIIRSRPTLYDKVTNEQPDSTFREDPNVLTRFFEDIHGRYFSDITNDEELLKQCYCDSEAAEKLEREIETVLRDRSPLLDFPIAEIETTKKSGGKFEEIFSKNKKNTKLFLLLGGTGVGKTTFIFRFFNYILSDKDKEFVVWLYLDFRKLSEEGKSVDDFVYEQMEEQLSEKYEHLDLYSNPDISRAIFAKDIKKEMGVINLLETEQEKSREIAKVITDAKKDKGHHIRRIFEFLRSKGYATCIVYDNVDQLDFDMQTRLFKHSNVVRENLNTTVLCSLREEVYYQHKTETSINFSEVELFHVPSPRLLNVLAKRIKLLKKEIEDQDRFTVQNSAGTLITVNKLDIVEVLQQSFLGEKENLLMLEMLSNNDIRSSLKYFKHIISSPNVNFDPLLISAGTHAVGKVANKVIESSQILRGLALQNRRHFNSNQSEPLINIFDIENDGFFSHFTKIRILKYAESRLNINLGQLQKGYFTIRGMYEEMFKTSVNSYENFLSICLKLQKVGVITNSKGVINMIDESDLIKLGPAGKYYLDNLIFNPYYLSLMAIDTPLSSKERHDELTKIYRSTHTESYSVKKRKFEKMATCFIQYLVEEEKKEREHLDQNKVEYKEEYFNISSQLVEGYRKFLERIGITV